MVVTAFIAGLLGIPAIFSRRWSLMISKGWARLVLWGLRAICGLGYEVRGATNLPQGRGLIAAKHQSMWETLALTAILPQPCFILKQELSRIPVFGWYCRANGFIFVDRADGARALRAMTTAARSAAERGAQIIIFPEGTRAAVGEALPYHPGVAALARALDLPCVPVAHNAGVFWTHPGITRRSGTITMDVMPALSAGMARKNLLAALETHIEPATRALEEEVTP